MASERVLFYCPEHGEKRLKNQERMKMMDKIKEILAAAGIELSDDSAKQIGDHIAESYVGKADHENTVSELNTANTTIAGLKETVQKFDGVDVDKLKDDLETLQTKYDTDIKQSRFDGRVNAKLAGARARDIEAVRAMLKMDGIKDDDDLTGLSEQLAALQKDKSYLFGSDTDTHIDTGGDHGDGSGGDNTHIDAFAAAAYAAAGITPSKEA